MCNVFLECDQVSVTLGLLEIPKITYLHLLKSYNTQYTIQTHICTIHNTHNMNTENNIENQTKEELQSSEKFNSGIIDNVCQNCGSHDGKWCSCKEEED